MHVDWKTVCQCAGYKSLKAAYIKDAAEARAYRKRWNHRAMREPDELYRSFQKALALVYKYAVAMNQPFEQVLGMCEEARDYWWLNFYQTNHLRQVLNFTLPKTTKPEGIRGMRKYLKQQGYDPAVIKRRIQRMRVRQNP